MAAGQPGEVDVPPSEGHEVAACGHIVRKSLKCDQIKNYKITRGDSESYEILTESAKKGASIDHPASKVDVDPEKAVLACFAGENGTLR